MLEILVIIFLVAGLGLWFFKRPKFETPQTAPSDQRTYKQFEAAQSVFVNRAELNFFHALRKAMPDGFFVLSKVRLEDVIGVKDSVRDAEARWKLRARVKSRHVDFVVIDDTGAVALGIELDGSVHEGQDSFNADTLKNGLFKSAGVPLLRVATNDDYIARAKDVGTHLISLKLKL